MHNTYNSFPKPNSVKPPACTQLFLNAKIVPGLLDFGWYDSIDLFSISFF